MRVDKCGKAKGFKKMLITKDAEIYTIPLSTDKTLEKTLKFE